MNISLHVNPINVGIYMNLRHKSVKYYMASTAAYGFYRGFTFNKTTGDELVVDRFTSGIVTSFMYSIPFMQPFYFYKLMTRIEIKLTNKDPSKYKSAYYDYFNYNYKTI